MSNSRSTGSPFRAFTIAEVSLEMQISVLLPIMGPLAHQLIFIHGEWHLHGPKIVIIHTIAWALLCATTLSLDPGNPQRALETIYLAAGYLLCLFTSIAIYRLFYHRLKHFPGPKLAALTKLWHVWKCRDSRGHLVLQTWYEEYGTFVRTGRYSHSQDPALE